MGGKLLGGEFLMINFTLGHFARIIMLYSFYVLVLVFQLRVGSNIKI